MPGKRVFASTSVSIMRVCRQSRQTEAGEFGIQEAEIERRVVRDQRIVAEERQHVLGDLGKARLARQMLRP